MIKKNKYDFIILDSPCSSIGTIRRNPEIFFKNHEPNFNYLLDQQAKLLKKTGDLLNFNGRILYMVCSFFRSETIDQINYFLKDNKNFALEKLEPNKSIFDYKELYKNGFIYTLPSKIKGFNIDGYFGALLKRIE